MKKTITIGLGLLTAILLLASGCDPGGNSSPLLSDKVAVYDGTGGWHESAVAAKAALVADSMSVVFVTENDIQASMSDYGLLVMTGNDPSQLLAALGSTGRFQIEDFVQRGGGFIGLGIGSYVASDSIVWQSQTVLEPSIGLYSGLASGPLITLAPPNGYAMVSVTLRNDLFNPALVPSLWIAYRQGPAMTVNYPAAASIGTIDLITNLPAGVAFERGAGRVVLFAVDPEFEENSSVDGTNWGSDLNDPDSDWFWLQYVAEWCLDQRQ